MYLADYHMHTHVSHDGAGTILDYARAAEERGISELCFTEHLDFFPSEDGLSCETRPAEEDLARYFQELRDAQRHTRVVLRVGVELDYKPHTESLIRELLGHFSFDFVMGSVHNVDGWPVSGPRERSDAYFEDRGFLTGCADYLEMVEKAVASGLFDSFGHIDLMKKFRAENGELMSRGELRDRMATIFDIMVSTGTGLDVNGSGLVHDAREPYPSPELLHLARDRGVATITLGSDSHRPDTVGRNIPEVAAMARDAGYRYYHTFSARVPTPREL